MSGSKITSSKILSAATATGAGSSFNSSYAHSAFQADGTTTSGSGAASITIQVSNDDTNWITLGTISLTLGTTATSDGFTSENAFQFHRAYVSSISGTGASVNVRRSQ